TSASRVTAVPRRSLNVTPAIAAFLHALPHDARNPSGIHGRASVEVKMIGPCFLVASSATLSGAPTGMITRAPLPQSNMGPIGGGPRKSQQVALALAGPQREQQRQVQMNRGVFKE